jgi:hypothetical protein
VSENFIEASREKVNAGDDGDRVQADGLIGRPAIRDHEKVVRRYTGGNLEGDVPVVF